MVLPIMRPTRSRLNRMFENILQGLIVEFRTQHSALRYASGECWVKAKTFKYTPINGIGVQYSSKAFQALCRVHGIKQSMGSVGDCYDNAQAESWFATLKRESVLKTDRLKSAKELRQQVIRYIESWYNTRRLHTSLGNRSPVEYEAQLKKAQPEVTSALKGAGNLSNPNVSTKLG